MTTAKTVARFAIPQALFFQEVSETIDCVARSSDFAEDWIPAVQDLLREYAIPLDARRFETIIFARPLTKKWVAIVQVGDLRKGSPQHVTRDGIGFRVFVIDKKKYTQYLGDPFEVAEQSDSVWEGEGELPLLSWPEEPLKARTVKQVQEVLKRIKHGALKEDIPGEEQMEEDFDPSKHTESPALLGGVQMLIDGGRLVFERPEPDLSLLKAMWTLLPQTSRIDLWPATFTFNNNIPFDMIVVSKYSMDDFPGYTTEDQAADYPEGSYELALQIAAESNDQDALDALYHRRTPSETLKMGIILLIAISLILAVSSLLQPPPPDPTKEQAKIVAGLVGMNNPLNATVYYKGAREAYYKLEKQRQP